MQGYDPLLSDSAQHYYTTIRTDPAPCSLVRRRACTPRVMPHRMATRCVLRVLHVPGHVDLRRLAASLEQEAGGLEAITLVGVHLVLAEPGEGPVLAVHLGDRSCGRPGRGRMVGGRGKRVTQTG